MAGTYGFAKSFPVFRACTARLPRLAPQGYTVSAKILTDFFNCKLNGVLKVNNTRLDRKSVV